MRKVLVVDDESDVADLFVQRFRREIKRGDVAFTFALSGEQALQIYEARPSDFVLILSDINMPGMSGFELLRRLRERAPELPVVMISAYGDAEKQQQARTLGAVGFVAKPIDFDLLRPCVLGEPGSDG